MEPSVTATFSRSVAIPYFGPPAADSGYICDRWYDIYAGPGHLRRTHEELRRRTTFSYAERDEPFINLFSGILPSAERQPEPLFIVSKA